ncbi:hypothetical protein BH23GEM9_BH23GEM9_05740 [soil metagenome]
MSGIRNRTGINRWAAVACILLACGRQAEPPAADEVAARASFDEGDSVFQPAQDRVSLSPGRIYISLTDHEWYARGQPLLHGNAAYQPVGVPVSASLAEMRHIGEYEGVDIYVRDGDDAARLYVPVFDGYWQVFQPDTAAPSG